MSKNIFKIMGALFVLVLAVSCTVGAVSATPITLYSGSIILVDGTYYAADGPNTELELTSFETDLGALAFASTASYGGYGYSASCDGTNYVIASLGGIDVSGTHNWNVFVNGVYYGSGDGLQDLKSVSQGDVVTACYVPNSMTTYATAVANAQYIISVTVSAVSAAPSSIYNGTVSLTPGTFTKVGVDGVTYTFNNLTGIGALNAASIAGGFTYNVSGYIYEGEQYTWIVDIDGVTGDWDKIAYGWGIYKNGIITESVENVQVSSGNTLNFYCCPSTWSGTSSVLTPDTADNYLSSSIYTLQIAVA